MRKQLSSNEEQADFFQRGQERGLQYFYTELHPALSHYANRWVKDRIVAEDMASEAIIRTWKFHAKLDSYAAIKAYLYRATGRLSQRYIGKEQRRKKVHAEVILFDDTAATPFDYVVRTETYALLRAAILKLSPGIRTVMTKHYLEGKKLIEIAEELQLSPKTISAQKNQGIAILRKRMIRPIILLSFLATLNEFINLF